VNGYLLLKILADRLEPTNKNPTWAEKLAKQDDKSTTKQESTSVGYSGFGQIGE
jgi:hypothetical protein